MNNKLIFKWWLVFFAISAVGGFLAGGFLGMIFGFCLGVFGAIIRQPEMVKPLVMTICPIVGMLASLPISYFAFKFAVGKILKESN
ncbi:MAG: hypothetical protein BWZ03_00638 [bacterium ADurb.BinA186]|nr:MAG: hypothetical protein BWZ03_00638 [bacterium ADurb.BinA186]